MDTAVILDFLKELCVNNNKAWFDSNRDTYKLAKTEFEKLTDDLIQSVSVFDSSIKDLEAKKCVFRIFRDARFAKNKPPYKTNFGAFLVPGGKKCAKAGYYLHLEPDASFIAGGIYMPPSPELRKIREHIFENANEYISITTDPAFVATFGQVEGDKLKTVPKGFPKDFEHIDLLRYKSYIVSTPVSDSDVYSGEIVGKAQNIFKRMFEFNFFLNQAL